MYLKSPRRRRELNLIRKCFEKHRCVPKIASLEARQNLIGNPLKSIAVYLKSPRRRRENDLIRKSKKINAYVPKIYQNIAYRHNGLFFALSLRLAFSRKTKKVHSLSSRDNIKNCSRLRRGDFRYTTILFKAFSY